ncbi:MAG: hypothetical protein WCX23_01435 [Candidatus Paceibacterota bacterium]|jgi:hypothetical protein|nr:hypothetical protein [Candidatus Paceibacterota bacterium]MDD4830553.1 hypothetical protein [Candidatus Paceibacterota bacterium]MDD4874778.1 hypothetical protein [Candidatus Paceibacterota bacterium]
MDKKLKLNIFPIAVVLAAFFVFSAPQNSLAWFDDLETAEANTMSASTLEFSASPVDDLPAEGIAPFTDYNHRLDLTKIGTLDFNYSISLGNFDDGGSGLCDNLTIKDDASGSDPVFIKDYALALASFPENSSLEFTIRLVANAPELQDQTCRFSYKIVAWQTDMPDAGTGFSDEKLVDDSILSDPWIVEPLQTASQVCEPEDNDTKEEKGDEGQGEEQPEKSPDENDGEDGSPQDEERKEESPAEIEETKEEPAIEEDPSGSNEKLEKQEPPAEENQDSQNNESSVNGEPSEETEN